MGKKSKNNDRSVSEIIQARPSYADIYSPDDPVKPEHSADGEEGIWYPPQLEWMAEVPEEIDESFHMSISDRDVEAEYNRILGIDEDDGDKDDKKSKKDKKKSKKEESSDSESDSDSGSDSESDSGSDSDSDSGGKEKGGATSQGAHESYEDSDGDSYETDSYETDNGSYETDQSGSAEEPKPVSSKSEIKGDKKSKRKSKKDDSDSSDSDDTSDSDDSSETGSDDSSSSGSSSEGTTSDGSDSDDSDDSDTKESGTKASSARASKSGSQFSGTKESDDASDDSSSLPQPPSSKSRSVDEASSSKRRSSKSSAKRKSEMSKSSNSSGGDSKKQRLKSFNFGADTDDSDDDSDDKKHPKSALSSSSDSSSAIPVGGFGARPANTAKAAPRMSRAQQNRAFMQSAAANPESQRVSTYHDNVVPEKKKKSFVQRLLGLLPFKQSSSGQSQQPSYPQQWPAPANSRAQAPAPAPAPSNRPSWFRKSAAAPAPAPAPQRQYRAPAPIHRAPPPRPPPPPPPPRQPVARQVLQTPAPFEHVNPQYDPLEHADGVSQISETGYDRRRQRERELSRPTDQYGYVDTIPRDRRYDREPTYLPSVASSHMSVRNTKAALSDMDPISIGFTQHNLPDYEPQREVRNTRSALSSMRPLSIPHERQRDDSKQKVALCDLEPLSVGLAYSPSLDDLSEKSPPYRYDLEAGWRRTKDDTGKTETNGRREVNLDEMLRVEREKKFRSQKEKTQQEDDVRRRLTNEVDAKERARRYREEERIRRIREEERARRYREEEHRRAYEQADRNRAPEVSDGKRDDVNKPVYFRLSLLCVCMICLLLGGCLGVGIWAILEYVVLKDENTPATVVVTPTNGPAAQPTTPPPTIPKTVEDILRPLLPDGGTSLGVRNSPQAKALEWLEQDSKLQSYSDGRILQRYGLAVFYYSTNGDNWTKNDRWLSEFDECTWYTAYDDSPCPSQDFSHLELGNNNIQGTLPVELVLLKNGLESISIGGTITGSLPSEYGDLRLLRTLQIHGTSIEGPISTNLKNLDFLETLDLGKNRLSGNLPPSLFSSMTRLQVLDLSNNRLSGTVPTEVGAMTSLKELSLRENFLAGSIPFEIGEVTNLQSLVLDGNGFNSMPRNLGFLKMLRVLSIRDNALSGTIPGELGLLTKLTALYLDRNELRWTIPAQLGELTELKDGLGLSDNSLVGEIPSELGRLYSLQNLLLGNNKLRGTIPVNLGSINRLHTLRLEGNNLSGTMPYAVCAGFSRDFSTFYADCSEVDCPCCNFCCSDSSSQCTCPFEETDPILCIP